MARYKRDDEKMSNTLLIAGAIVAVLVIMAVIFVLQPSKERVTNFEECAEAGYQVMESYPRQCRTPGGERYIENVAHPPETGENETSNETQLCVDMCGDGECQKIVCLGEGCPCAETPESCPEDCAAEEEELCIDMCGDGICQEIVCLGEGCPCAETGDSCPEDCERELSNGYYAAKDPVICEKIYYECGVGMESFSNESGCGCRDIGVDEQGRHFCTEEQKNADVCVTVYEPVCGWFTDDEIVDCPSYPCAIEFSNSCNACKEKVDYWTEGNCPKTG